MDLGASTPAGGKALVVDQGWVVAADPLHRIRRVGDDGVKGTVVGKVRFFQRVAQLEVELVVVHVVQEHVHPRQVVRGVVDFLPKEAVFDQVLIEVLLGLQQQRARAASRVVDLVDAGLPVHRQLRNQLGDLLRREELAA